MPVKRFAVCLLTLLVVAAPALAQREIRTSPPDTYRIGGVARGYSANIRERPARDAKRIGQIPSGTRKIRGFGCTNDTPAGDLWCRVKYGEVVGWVSEEFIRQD